MLKYRNLRLRAVSFCRRACLSLGSRVGYAYYVKYGLVVENVIIPTLEHAGSPLGEINIGSSAKDSREAERNLRL